MVSRPLNITTFLARFSVGPSVSGVAPQSISTMGALVTVSGSGFSTGCKVMIGSTACGTVVVASLTMLTCLLPAITAGRAPVIVSCGSIVSYGGNTSVTVYPTVTTLSSTAALVSAGGLMVMVSGTGYNPVGCTVTVGNTPCTISAYSSGENMNCTTPALAAGNFMVTTACGPVIAMGNVSVVYGKKDCHDVSSACHALLNGYLISRYRWRHSAVLPFISTACLNCWRQCDFHERFQLCHWLYGGIERNCLL